MMAHETNRRERKKRATENAIEEAAVALALAYGHEAVTVPAICERADVSRSTFFNYMGTKESAIFGRPLEMLPSDQALAILESHPSSTSTVAVAALVIASLPHPKMNPTVAVGRARLLAEQPGTHGVLLAQFVPLSTQVTALVAHWLTERPSRRALPHGSALREASLTVSAVMAAFIAVISDASGSSDATLTVAALESAMRDSARLAPK